MIEANNIDDLRVSSENSMTCFNGVEDEMHFLFSCKKLEKLQLELLYREPEILQYMEKLDKFLYLLNKPYILGSYIDIMWQERAKILNNVKSVSE